MLATLQSLLLCRDPEIVQVMRNALGGMRIDVDVCSAVASANERLARRKYDAVIIDCDGVEGAETVLRSVRKSNPNRTSIVFALTGAGTDLRSAFDMGANFVLGKPFTTDLAARTFRAARSLMLAERRRYFRHVMEMPVHISFGQQQSFQLRATSTNISEAGMALRVAEPMEIGRSVHVSFDLPGTQTSLDIKGEVSWSDGEGRAGIRFLHIPMKLRRAFEAWLDKNAPATGE